MIIPFPHSHPFPAFSTSKYGLREAWGTATCDLRLRVAGSDASMLAFHGCPPLERWAGEPWSKKISATHRGIQSANIGLLWIIWI